MEYLLLSTRPKLNQNSIVKVIADKLKTVDHIIYIGSESVIGRPYFQKVEAFYNAITSIPLTYVDFDQAYDEKFLKYDHRNYCLHLSTGNTYTFLNHIKCKNGLELMSSLCNNANLVVATSAGNHLLSPDISYAQFGDESPSCNDDLEALNLLPFYFVPHYNKKRHLDAHIKGLSSTHNKPVYYIEDHQGFLYDTTVKLMKKIGENHDL